MTIELIYANVGLRRRVHRSQRLVIFSSTDSRLLWSVERLLKSESHELALLRRYRASVLKSAVEGRLTAAWRSANPGVEPASELLARILRERRQRWEQQQLATYESKGKKPPKNWQSKYKEPATPDIANLPELPNGWCWATLGQIALFHNGRAFPSKEYTDDGVRLLGPGNLFADGSVVLGSGC